MQNKYIYHLVYLSTPLCARYAQTSTHTLTRLTETTTPVSVILSLIDLFCHILLQIDSLSIARQLTKWAIAPKIYLIFK